MICVRSIWVSTMVRLRLVIAHTDLRPAHILSTVCGTPFFKDKSKLSHLLFIVIYYLLLLLLLLLIHPMRLILNKEDYSLHSNQATNQTLIAQVLNHQKTQLFDIPV